MSITITYFVHGTTTDNEQDRSTGWLPGELSELGIQQAKELGEKVGIPRFAVMFCSDLKRAVDSARLGVAGKCEIIPDKRLRECNYGDFNGGKEAEFKSDMKKYIDISFPGGESYKDVEKRLVDFLEFLKRDYDGQHIAILAHQAPQLALDVILKGKNWEQAIDEDWREQKAWQPGWEYTIK